MADIKTNQAKLYKALQGVGFKDLGSEEQFAAKLQDAGNREKLYKALQKQGFKDLGDYSSFEGRIYDGGTQKTDQPSVATEQAAVQQKRPEQKPQQPQQPLYSFAELDTSQAQRMGLGRGPISWDQPEEPKEETPVDKAIRVVKGKGTEAENKEVQNRLSQRMDEAEYENQTGKRLKQKVLNPEWEAPTVAKDDYGNIRHDENGNIITGFTTDEGRVGAHQQIVQEQQDFDKRKIDLQQNEQLAQQRLDELNRELKNINDKYEEEFMEKEKGKTILDRFFEAFRMPTVNGQTPFTEYKMQNRTQDENALISNKRIFEETMNSIEDAKRDMGLFKEDDPWYKKTAKGLGRAYGKALDVASNPETWDFGASDMEKQFSLLQAVIRNDNGIASKAEKDLLNDFALSTVLHGNYDGNISGWTKAGLVTGESLPFMLEMFANPAAGIGSKVSEQAFKYAVKKYGAKYVRDHVKSIAAKKIAAKVTGDLVGAHVMAGTTGALRTAANAYERMRGDIKTGVDENGRIIYDGHEVGDAAFDAFSKAWRDTAIENWSEMAGEYLPVMTGFFGKAIGKAVVGKAGREALKITGTIENVGLNKVQKFIYDLAANNGIGAFSKGLDDFLKRTQWHGVLGEYSEEVLGNLANALTIGDMTLDTAEGTGVFNLQQNIDTFNGVALMGGFTSALQTGGFGLDRYRNSVSRRDQQGSELFGNDWNWIKNAIDTTVDDARDLNDTLTDILSNGKSVSLSEDQKKAVLNYTSALLQSKGAEMAHYQPRMQSSTMQEIPTPEGKRYIVSSLDKNGETIEQQVFETEDEATAFEGELKMKQQHQDFKTYFDMSFKPNTAEADATVDAFLKGNGYDEADDLRKSVMLAALNDPNTVLGKQFQMFRREMAMKKAEESQNAIADFEDENGWSRGTVKWLTEQDPMELDEEGLQMADQAREFLETIAYPEGEVHIEYDKQKGEETGKAVVEQVISETESIDPNDNAGKQLMDAYNEANAALNALFERNEKLKDEFYDMQARGFSPQEIISSLDTFSPEEVQTVINYFNADARYAGFMNEASKQIYTAAFRDRMRHTFQGTINGVQDKDNLIKIQDEEGNVYTLVSGNITTDSQNNITGSESGLIIGVDQDGNFVNLQKGLKLLPISQTLNDYEEGVRSQLQEAVSGVVMPNGPQMQPVPETANTGTGSVAPAPETQNEGTNETALSRIPKDEGGNPIYEQASPEDTYDAFVEQVGENTAKILVQKQIEKAKKNLERLNKKMEKGDFEGNTIQEQIASSQALQQQIEATQATINYWNKVLAVPNNRMLNAANNQTTGQTINPPATPTQPANEAPEWRNDTPQAARERGYKIVEGQRIDRQEEKPMPQGMEVEVQYSTKDKVKGRMTVSELGDVQGSHLINGQVNDKHFLPEAQPKAEFGADRQAAAQTNASEENFRPELMLTFNGVQSAYSGSASQTNRRGEVIQGNGRRNLAEYIYAPGNEAVAQKYKTFLKAHAAELGTTPEAIDAMEKPFAHIVLDVTDEEAIRLGQFTAADLETGGKKIPDVSSTVTKLGNNYGSFANILLRHDDPDASLAERVEKNMEDVVNWLNRGGYINNTEAKSLLEDKEAARQFLKDMLTDVLFKDANPNVRTSFYELPKNIQNAIVSVVGREVAINPDASILKDIQESIQAYHDLMAESKEFASVKGNNFEERYRAANAAVSDWLRQINLDGSLNQGKYSNFALELAKLYVSLKDQKTLASRLRQYYDIMSNAPREGGLFDAPAETGTMTREQALEQIFGVKNGTQRTMPMAGNNQAGQRGSGGGPSTTQSGEREEGEGGPANSGGGSTGQSPVGEGSPQISEREKYIAEHPLTEAEIDAANASPAQKILAKQYLNSKDDYVSEMAKAAYTYIYNKKLAAQNKPQQGETKPAVPKNEAPTRAETPHGEAPQTPPTGEQPGGTKNSAQAAAMAKMAAALAKLKKHGKKSDNNTDAYSIENLTPEQIEDMFEVVEAGAELGYTLLDGVQTKEEWIAQMRESIAEPLKDATGYNDTEVDELLNDMWNYPYEVEGQSKPVSEWAAEKGINVNEIENGTEQEGNVVGDNPTVEQPGSGIVGGSAEAGVGQSSNNEGESGTSGESGIGTVVRGSNSGTQSGGQTNRGGQRTGSTGQTRRKARGTTSTAEPGNLFGEDTGNGTNDTPGIEQGGTAATVPEGGIVVSENGKEPKKPLADITQEKSPYKPASIGGKFAIGSVIPSGIVDSIANAFKRLKDKFFPKKGSTLDFVREELGYKTNEEMLSDFESGKTDGLAAEQVDAVALAIGKMKDGKSFIVGDMTGVGKGRTAAALIRWGLKHGKKVLFVTEKSGLFSDMHRDLTDIGCDYLPFVTNSDSDANITDADGNKVIPKPMLAAQKALWQSGSDKLPKDKKGRQYDFVMTTYSQVNGNEKGDKKKAEWLREYAKDAIVIMDESHNASGESNTGAYFKEVVENASGVTFLSATYAKRPDNMLLYAIKSSMSAINMPVQSFLEAIKEYGVAMQELMASALFGSGEMIRRERDMSDVKTTWTDPKEIYSEEEYEQCRKTSDKTMDLINDIIQFQRDYVNPIVADHEKDYEQQNKLAALIGGVQTHAGNTAYKSQVSNITNLMVYAMKAKKAAEMAIEQIKQGKKPVIAVSNTMGSYIDELEDDIPEAGFRPIFDKGVKFSLRYVIADYEKGDDGKYHKIKGSERVFDAEDELNDAGERALENLRQRIEDYMGDTDKVDLSLSPIDLVKQMIADAGYNCGEITGRSTQLVKKEGGGYTKTSIRQNKKEAARKFNGGSKDKPIPEDEQYQALILNVAGATGISLHSSKKFGNQQPRTMIILQPNADVNKEVQMRGRIDRTGQVHRGEYFYMSSPIPAEQKITMMLKQKLASLDAQSVGTKQVSSNKVEGQDMDNKYGDEVCYQYLLEHLNDVNAYLEDGLQWNRKTREWEGRPGLLYDVMKALQRMPCEMQEKVIAELTQRYADQIEYLNQNGINDLETTTMDLEAVTIDKATFVKGKDNESENEFAHDTAIERVEVNVLKKPMRSSDIKKKMKELDALDEDGLPKEGVLGQTDEKVKAMMEQKIADRQARYDEQEAKLEEKVRSEHPKKPERSDEEYEAMIKSWPSLVEMQNKHKADIAQYSADLQNQYNMVYRAGMYLKPGRPYLVPLTDDISDNGALMYGRFLGFQLKNGDPRQVQAVFAVKDSRAMITIPVVNKNKVIDKIIYERGDIDISELETDKNSYNGDLLPMEQRAKNWDEWWDKMIPKNTNRQVRFMITGNVLQACGSLGKYKGQIVTFTRKNKETGEITLERGMLLAENFDPENFRVRRPVEKKDVWDSYDEVKDERSGISCYREGGNMVVKFEKRKGEKLSEHPVQKDETLKQMAMNNEIRPSGKSAILCVIKEDNAEKALEHLYKEYGYTKEELFVMPDSTEKPDAIVRTNRPWKDIIDEFAEKYGRNQYSVEHRIKQMLKRYKMDVNNEDLKQQIREAVQLRQAYLRRDYANKESNRLAWQVLIEDQYIERYKDDKEDRERHMRIKEAILEELEFRGFKGNAYHFEQGKITLDDVKNMFNQMNDLTTEEGRAKKALFDKVMEKVSKLPMEIFMNEKLDNDTGGWAGGRIINYNWKYMNADYIADQAKADTILHELIHTVTAYADRCVENGLEHLLDQEMVDAINELHGIFEAIKNDSTFEHDGDRAYGLTNVREMLSEAGSNSEFRADLKKTNLWQKIWMNVLKFFGIKQNVQGAKQVNALESVLLRLDYLIENFNKSAWETFYQGTNMGGYGYKKADMQRFDNSKSYEISQYRNFGPMSIFYKTKNANVMQDGKKVANIYKSDQGYQAETPNWSYATEWYPTEKEALDALAKYQEEQEKADAREVVKDKVLSEFVSSYRGDGKGRRIEIGTLTEEGRKFLENVSGLTMKPKVSFILNASDLRHIYNEHYGENEKDKGNNIPLDENDIRSLVDVIIQPTKVVFGVDKKSGRKVFYFLKDSGNGTYNLAEVYSDKHGNLTAKTFYKTKKGSNLRADELLNSPTLSTSKTSGASLSSSANIPNLFEITKDSTEFNTSKQQKDDMTDRRVYDPIESVNRAAEDWRRAEDDRKADVADLDSYSAKQVYHERINRAETMFTESWQDDMVTFKDGQNAIAKDKDIPDSQNAYQAMNLSYGKTYVEQEQFENQYKKPLIETVNKILKKTGWRMGDVDRYLFTKHGFERNRELFVRDWLQLERVKAKDDQTQLDHIDGLESDYIMMKNENYQKLREGKITFKQYLDAIDSFIKGNMDKKYVPEEHDYSGFTEMFGDKDGDYDEADILAEMEQQENEMGDSLRDQLWSQINDCSQYGLDRYRQSGMISEDTYKRISNMFHWYVPMRGFNEGMASQDHWQYMTAKDGAGRIGGLLKKAKGRKSEAGFPLATLFGMTNKAISDCNQNEVKQHLWRLVQAHPNDLVKVSDAWVVKDPTTGEWKTTYPQIDSDMSPQMKEAKVKEFEERMRYLEASGDAMRLKNSAKRTRFDYKVDNQHRGEHIVEVMINGDRKYMIVTGNPRMALAINGELRYQGGKGMVSRALNTMKQFMQSVSTSFNITFLGRNMARDWTHFGAILAVREGAGYEKAAQKYYWEQLPKMVSLFKKFREGKLDMRNEMERDFKDFMENGGITGFVNMQKVEAIQKEMENFIKKQKDGSLLKVNSKFYDLTLGAIEAMNEAVENNARFATYRASRHYAGRTKARSAYDAKEVTVNFNKKGAGRKTTGFKSDLGKKTITIKTPFGSKTIEYNPVEASAKLWGETGQILAANKMFFNATVQAICTIFKNTQNKDGSLNWPYIAKLASAYAAPPFILGFVMPYINQQLVALAGGDGDDDPYANLPEWTRRKNICLYLGWIPGCGKDDFLTIPIGQELAAFYSLGDMLAGKTYDKNLEPLDKDFADEMLGFLNVFSPVDFDTKITSEDHAAPISEYVGRVYSVAAPLVAIGENMSWNGRPIFRNDKYNGDEYIPEYKMAFNSTNQQFVAASKFLNDISGGDDVSRGAIQINPATMQYLVEQYTGGPGKLFANTLVSAGRDLKNFITNDEVDFNIRKIEGIRAFYQQGDDRTQFYRTQAKYRKYKEEADEFGYKLKAYEKDAATNPDHYMKLMELARGKELARYNIINEVDKSLKELNTAANQAEGRTRKNLRALYNSQLQLFVEQLDKVNDIEK